MKWLVCLLSLTVMSVAQAATLDCLISGNGSVKQAKVELKEGKASLKRTVDSVSYDVSVEEVVHEGQEFYYLQVKYSTNPSSISFAAPKGLTSVSTFIPVGGGVTVLLGCSIN